MKQNLFLRFATAAGLVFSLAMAQLPAANSVDTVISSGLFEPYDVAVAGDGTAYLVDSGSHRIIKVAPGAASVSVLAGDTGVPGTNDGVGEAARFYFPRGIVVARGGLIVADSGNHTLRFVTFNGQVSTLAGSAGAFGNDNGAASSARFRFPMGIANDADGNIFVADSQNDAIRKLDTNNIVSTVAANSFIEPSGVAVGANGDLWVADTWQHCIRRIDTNGVVTLVAGAPNVPGTANASVATSARFNSPRGLHWVSAVSGLLVADSGNHSIRRVYYNANINSFSVETFAGQTGLSGSDNGDALEAKFNNPVGIARDELGGGYLIADKGNNLLRRINTGAVQPPVPDPVIGWVDIVYNPDIEAYVTLLRPVISGTFNNDVVIAIPTIAGTETIYTAGTTPPNPFEDTIPDPGPGSGSNPPLYRDGELASIGVPPTLIPVQPDITVKAIGTAEGRRSSSIVRARFIFKTANPTIIGDNAASFVLTNITDFAEMWYTWDGSEPTRGPQAGNTNTIGPVFSGDIISFNLGNSNRTFKAKAYRNNFKESGTITKVFSPTNFVANKISFGFENGEASSEFVAAAGQRFYAPITLSVLPQQLMYSFQFNVVVTNETGTPVDGASPAFQSMLQFPVPDNGDKVGVNGDNYETIPPQMVIYDDPLFPVFADAVINNPSVNLLGVGWIERRGEANLFPTRNQDLITFSQAHDTVFNSSAGKVVLGGYSFLVPSDAPAGSTYSIQIGRASATSDGTAKDVYIQIPTNGSLTAGPINGTKRVTIGIRRYIVGDAAPFRWFNAGDFGDTNLLNNDVLQVFQSAIYGINVPPPRSDLFDAMDSSNGTVADLYNGDIDSIQFGDDQLNVDDIFVTFRRSLDPSLKWYARYWDLGLRQAVEVPNYVPQTDRKVTFGAKPKVEPTGIASVVVSADDIVGNAGDTVAVPIRAHITGGLPIRVLGLGVSVEALGGSPALTQPITLSAAAGLGSPSMGGAIATNKIGAAWLNTASSGASGDTVLATLMVKIPSTADSNTAYRIRFDHFSASENGMKLFRKYVTDGVVSTRSRTGSSWGDAISDAWRLRFFGAVSNALASATADPDGDGVNNLGEYLGGTQPLNFDSSLKLKSAPAGPSAVKLMFPTGTGRTYVIDCAPGLLGPWSPLTTNTGDGGEFEYLNTATGINQRFYRVRTQ